MSQPRQGWWQPQDTPHGAGFGQGYPGRYGGLGAFEQGTPTHGKRSRKPLLFAVVGVVLLAAGVCTTWLLGVFDGPVLERKSLENEVARVLHDSYGERAVTDTACPADQPIETGHTFTCSVTVSGTPMRLTVRVLNNKPVFTVGAPRP